MLEFRIEAAPDVVGDLAARVMARWPGIEVRAEEGIFSFRLPLGERLDEDLAAFEEALKAVEKARGIQDIDIQSRNLAGPDSGPNLLKVGRFVIRGPECPPTTVDEGGIELDIEAGESFGTGAHPTTALALIGLDEYFHPGPGEPSRLGARVLDAGAGSGILSLAAARLGAGFIKAIDPSASAVAAARQNAQRCGVMVDVAQMGADQVDGEYDLVLANLAPSVLLRVCRRLASTVAPDGTMIVSGYPDSMTPQVVKALTRAGLTAVKSYSRSGWGGLRLAKTPELRFVSVEEFTGKPQRKGVLAEEPEAPREG
jgi:ribosomal protein L11 methylase PrmA